MFTAHPPSFLLLWSFLYIPFAPSPLPFSYNRPVGECHFFWRIIVYTSHYVVYILFVFFLKFPFPKIAYYNICLQPLIY